MPATTEPPRTTRGPWLGLAVVLLVAALLRLVALGHVDRLRFDETYYAQDALAMVEQGVEEERPAHPPMGKWVLAVGIAIFGFEPFAWRLGAAVAGIAAVAATYLIGVRVLRDRWLAVATAALVAVDGLAITSSRIAMLDGVLAGFVALAAVFVLRHQRDAAAPVSGRSLRPAGWPVWAAGLLLGACIATKWSALPYLAVAVLAAAWAEVRRRAPSRGVRRAAVEGGASVLLPLVVVPVLVYTASYAGMFVNYTDSKPYEQRCPEQDCPAPVTERIAGIVWHHGDLIRMHRSLEHTHPYRSSALSWAVQRRPVLSYLERCPTDEPPCDVPEGTTARIVMVGNPVVWWTALAALPFVGWAALR
jgi:dolichyl-phosphate-mannose-protein mannosyltransferase